MRYAAWCSSLNLVDPERVVDEHPLEVFSVVGWTVALCGVVQQSQDLVDPERVVDEHPLEVFSVVGWTVVLCGVVQQSQDLVDPERVVDKHSLEVFSVVGFPVSYLVTEQWYLRGYESRVLRPVSRNLRTQISSLYYNPMHMASIQVRYGFKWHSDKPYHR